MVDQERDRYGDKMREVERAREDDYFARRDRELIKKMREGGAQERCPKCSGPVTRIDGNAACPECSKP